MIIPYVYYIKNLITGQFYFGSRSRNVILKLTPEEDLWNKYFTSSHNVDDLITEYGKDSFEIKIIFKFEDANICYWYEQLCIKNSINDFFSLNFHYIDPDSEKKCFNRIGIPHSEESKIKMRKPKTEEAKIKMRLSKQKFFSDENNRTIYRDRIRNLIYTGVCKRKFTKDQRDELSVGMANIQEQLQAGRAKMMDEDSVYREFLSSHMTKINKSRIGISLTEEHKSRISEGGKNKPYASEEARKNLSASLIGKPKTEAHKEAMKKAWENRAPISEEARKNLSIAGKLAWEKRRAKKLADQSLHTIQ